VRNHISSQATNLIKYGAVPTLAVAFVIAVVAAITQASHPWFVLPFIAVPLVVFGSTVRFAHVIATDSGLEVGTSARAIPYTAITNVWSMPMVNPTPVTVTLASGDKIRFFAPVRRASFRPHPVAAELRKRAGLG
jgi:hypothetical protein